MPKLASGNKTLKLTRKGKMLLNLPSIAPVLHDGVLNVGDVGVEESVARVWILVLGLKRELY